MASRTSSQTVLLLVLCLGCALAFVTGDSTRELAADTAVEMEATQADASALSAQSTTNDEKPPAETAWFLWWGRGHSPAPAPAPSPCYGYKCGHSPAPAPAPAPKPSCCACPKPPSPAPSPSWGWRSAATAAAASAEEAAAASAAPTSHRTGPVCDLNRIYAATLPTGEGSATLAAGSKAGDSSKKTFSCQDGEIPVSVKCKVECEDPADELKVAVSNLVDPTPSVVAAECSATVFAPTSGKCTVSYSLKCCPVVH